MGTPLPASATIIQPTPTSTIITETFIRTLPIAQPITMVLIVRYHYTYVGVRLLID